MAFVTCTWSSSSEHELDWLFHTRDRLPTWIEIIKQCLTDKRYSLYPIMRISINQPVQLNGIRHKRLFWLTCGLKVALEDREGRRFEDKGSCQHVPWQAIDQKITQDPSKNEEPQNVYWKFPASCLLEKRTRRKDREQSSGLNSVSVCWILLLGALANGMFLHSHN